MKTQLVQMPVDQEGVIPMPLAPPPFVDCQLAYRETLQPQNRSHRQGRGPSPSFPQAVQMQPEGEGTVSMAVLPQPPSDQQLPPTRAMTPMKNTQQFPKSMNIPKTNLIPPTPMDQNKGNKADDCSNGEGVTSPTPIHDPFNSSPESSPVAASSARGQLSDANRAKLKDAFAKLDEIVSNVSQESGLAIDQILSLWDRSQIRSRHRNNSWNAYQKYFSKHLEAELARVPGATLKDKTRKSTCLISMLLSVNSNRVGTSRDREGV